MPRRDLLIRDIPESLHEWIENERYSKHMSKTEFILKSLHERAASPAGPQGQSTLFDLRPQPALPLTGAFPFTFIDLFAGIGGMRLGLQQAGGRNVFSSEWDRYAQKTYCAWFNHTPHGDIRKITPDEIPDHDILAAGFPCQPFSIAGVSKKNSLGRLHGFQDESQGNLFFVLAAIAEAKRPLAMILENVKNLISHDKGRTWATIKRTLEDLDYKIFHKVIDARDYVPQHRERIFIVCFDRHVFGDAVPFRFPSPPDGRKPRLSGILEPDPSGKYTLSDHLWKYLQEYAQRHKEKGNGFGFGLADLDSVSRTLSARYYKDGSEILIPQKDRNPRRLTPRECARLMGFPDDLPIVVSDTQAYRQFGNSLVPPIAEAVARAVTSVFHATMLSRGVSQFMAATTAKTRSGSSQEVQHLVATR